MSGKPVGLSKDAGWQIGVRRTLKVSQERLWQYLLSPEGLRLWLGELPGLELALRSGYRTAEGTVGELRAVKPREQLRLTWQPQGWARASTVQIRLLPLPNGRTTVAFHQEQLTGPEARAMMKQRWETIAARLGELEE